MRHTTLVLGYLIHARRRGDRLCLPLWLSEQPASRGSLRFEATGWPSGQSLSGR